MDIRLSYAYIKTAVECSRSGFKLRPIFMALRLRFLCLPQSTKFIFIWINFFFSTRRCIFTHVWINVYAWPSQRIELIGYLFFFTLFLGSFIYSIFFLVHFIIDIVLVICRSFSTDFYCLFIIRHVEKKTHSLSHAHTHLKISVCKCVFIVILHIGSKGIDFDSSNDINRVLLITSKRR